jgi:hypothetical protein
MNLLPWILVIALGAGLIVQGVVLRNAHRRRLALQQAVLAKSQLAMNGKLDKTKQQISQLQTDLSQARMQLKRASRQDVAVPLRAVSRQSLERDLDDTTASRYALPMDGFADTQPASPDTQHGSLLLQ